MMSEWPDGKRPERVDGKTFEEWVAEYAKVVPQYQARQIAARKFGWRGDAMVGGPDGERLTPREMKERRAREAESSEE